MKRLLRSLSCLVLLIGLTIVLAPVNAEQAVEECTGDACQVCYCECANAHQACIDDGTPLNICHGQRMACESECFWGVCAGK